MDEKLNVMLSRDGNDLVMDLRDKQGNLLSSERAGVLKSSASTEGGITKLSSTFRHWQSEGGTPVTVSVDPDVSDYVTLDEINENGLVFKRLSITPPTFK